MHDIRMVCSLADTADVANAIAPLLRSGDVLILKGGLAAGKTNFVKCLVRALGSADEVTSPTFTIAQFYHARSGLVLHIDAYRLSGAMEFRDLGLDEFFTEAITAIEWGDKIEEEFTDFLSIEFRTVRAAETLRELRISSVSSRWEVRLEQLQAALKREQPCP